MSKSQSQNLPCGMTVKTSLHPSAALQPHFAQLARQILQWAGERDQPVAIGVAGLRPRSGASTVCFNLSVELKKAVSRPVLFVEANFGHPFAVKPSPRNRGLGELLLAMAELSQCVIATSFHDLVILPAGALSEMEARRINFEGLSPLIREQMSDFQYVLFDLPVLDESTTSLNLAGRMDGLVVVVEPGQVERSRLLKFRPSIESLGTEMIGVVMNKTG